MVNSLRKVREVSQVTETRETAEFGNCCGIVDQVVEGTACKLLDLLGSSLQRGYFVSNSALLHPCLETDKAPTWSAGRSIMSAWRMVTFFKPSLAIFSSTCALFRTRPTTVLEETEES